MLVLGGLGFLGRHVCRQFQKQGVIVYALGHGSIPFSEIKIWGVDHWVESGITLDTLIYHFGDVHFDAVIHCAGSGSVALAYQQPLDDYNRSVTSVLAGLEFARTTQTKNIRFVLASSAAVYGDKNIMLTETSHLSPVSPYGLHKKAAENVCKEYSKYFSVNCSVVRLFSIYGAGLQKQLLWDAANKFKNGEQDFFGTGNEMRDWIHVDDAAQLMIKAALKEQSVFDVYNGGNYHASTREVLMLLASSLGFNIMPQFNKKTHAGNPLNLIADSRKAKQVLHWMPEITLQDGFSDYAKWFIQSNG